MKKLLATSLLICSPLLGWAANTLSGEVLEIKEVESYTYLRLKTSQGETWAAVSKAPVKKGAKVSLENTMVMNNFESKSLNRTFPTIVFGSLAGTAGSKTALGAGMSTSLPKAAEVAPVKVAKASGANAYTVADIIGKASQLKDKPVTLNGKIVKYNAGIMGKNWLHLQDGSGTAASNTHDLLVTSLAEAKVGDSVTVSGVVRTDKDFGSGYSYKVLVEEATLKPLK